MKLRQSRESWKQKATARANTLRDREKTINHQNNRLKQQSKIIKKQKLFISELKLINSKPLVADKVALVNISMRLKYEASISTRAVARVLGVLSSVFGGFKAPSHQTVANWMSKLSLSRFWKPSERTSLNSAGSRFTNGWVYIIDECVGHSSGKMLLILGVALDHYKLKKGFPNRRDMSPVAVAVAQSWTGDTISEFLQGVIERSGRPAAYIMDGGGNLKKAMTLLDEQGMGSPVIRDISHICANLLKEKYEKNPSLDSFLSICGKSAAKLKQSLLACLTPPKVRTKVRFMNLGKLALWGKNILELVPDVHGPSRPMTENLKKAVSELPEHRPFVGELLGDVQILLKFQELIKNDGLSDLTSDKCLDSIKNIENGIIKDGLTNWIVDNKNISTTLGVNEFGMLSSSDNIESTFGMSKSHGSGFLKDTRRMALNIGALCGQITHEDAINIIEMPHSVMQKAAPPGSLLSDRVGILKCKKDIEILNRTPAQTFYSILPQSKNRDFTRIIPINSGDSRNTFSPKKGSVFETA